MGQEVGVKVPVQLEGCQRAAGLSCSRGGRRRTNADIGLGARLIDGDPGDALNPLLDEVGDVRDDLDGFAQVVAAALPQTNFQVDLAGCDVVVSGQVDAQISLVVSKVQIALATIASGVSPTLCQSFFQGTRNPICCETLVFFSN